MSLKVFHLFFIVVSILFSAYLGFWGLAENSDTPNTVIFGIAIGSFVASVGLTAYLFWFLKKSKNIGYLTLFIAFGLSLASSPANACPVCLGNPNHPMTKSANAGVWFLLVVISGVLVGFASLFCFWISRARRAENSIHIA